MAELTYGNYNQIRAAGGDQRPDRRRRSPAGSTAVYARRDGFYHVVNPTGGTESRVNDRDRFFVRGQLLFEPNDALSFRLIGDYTNREESCCGAVYLDRATTPAIGNLNDPANPLLVGGVTNPTATTSSTCCATSASRWPGSAIPTAGPSTSARAAPIEGDTEDWGVSLEVELGPRRREPDLDHRLSRL